MYWRKGISDQLSESLSDALFLVGRFSEPIWEGHTTVTRERLRSPSDHPVFPLWNNDEATVFDLTVNVFTCTNASHQLPVAGMFVVLKQRDLLISKGTTFLLSSGCVGHV